MSAALICATSDEYTRCRDCLNAVTERELKNRRISTWSDETIVTTIIYAGPGKIQCASAAQLLIDEFSPDLVIDSGSAGSLDPSNQIGCIVISEKCFEYDICPVEQFARLSQDLTTSTIAAHPDKRIREILTEFSSYVVESKLIPSVKFGNIASGERNVADAADRERLRIAFNALACNWETAAVLKTAALNGIPSLSIRVITDKADENASNDYRDNLNRSLEILGRFLKAFICEGWACKIISMSRGDYGC